jgi:microcystin-dependent protein
MVNFDIKDGVDTTSSTNSYIPTGSLIIKATPPSALLNYDTDAECIAVGIIPCDGRTLNAATYASYQNLFNIIGNIYGGTNNTNFKVPDLRTSRRYIYGQSVVSGGIYTPSLSANTTNSVTHSHSVNGMSGENLNTNAANISAGIGGSHSQTVNYSTGASNATHSHSVDYTMPGFTVGQGLGTTLTKADGTGTAAGAAHTHTFNATALSSSTSSENMYHGHSEGDASGGTTSYSEATHSHTISSANVSIPVSSAIDIPYVNMLYFIKI